MKMMAVLNGDKTQPEIDRTCTLYQVCRVAKNRPHNFRTGKNVCWQIHTVIARNVPAHGVHPSIEKL